MLQSRLIQVLAVLGLALLGPAPSGSQPDSTRCAHDNPGAYPHPMPLFDLNEPARALFVLARFPDDGGAASCNPDPWPATEAGAPVPYWATLLLEDGVPQAGSLSLTSFFYQMSGGQHLLTGVTYPEVLVLNTIAHYRTQASPLAAANADVIDAIDSDPEFNFGNFDLNDDKIVDFVFICYRDQYGGSGGIFENRQGVSQIDFPGAESKAVEDGLLSVSFANGAVILPLAFQRGPAMTRGIAIHEYGHDILDIARLSHPLPPNHIWSMGHYGVMDGIDADVGIGAVMETLLRWKLNWITPAYVIEWAELQAAEHGLVLSDVGANGGSGVAIVKTPDPKQYFLIECRDSTASTLTNGDMLGGPTGCQSARRGNSGLVIQHISEHKFTGANECQQNLVGAKVNAGWWMSESLYVAPECDPIPDCVDVGYFGDIYCCVDQKYVPTIDIESAEGLFDLTSWAPDAVEGHDRMSCPDCERDPQQSSSKDLFGNGGPNVFAPYTNPNTNLYWFAPNDPNEIEYNLPTHCDERRKQSIPSGITFYNMEWQTLPGGGAGVMQLKVRYDPPPAPGTPHALPDGMEWAGPVQLIADVEVPSGGTLTLKRGTTVVAAASQGVGIKVAGSIDLQDAANGAIAFTSSRDPLFTHYLGSGESGASAGGQDWQGMKVSASGTVILGTGVPVGAVDIRYAREALAFSTSQFPADLEKIDFVSNTFDVTFDRDVTVPIGVAQVIPAGWDIGFASTDAQNAADGKDAARIECIVKGSLEFAGTAIAPVTLSSTSTTPSAGLWYGARTTNLVGQILGQHVVFKHALGALSLEESPSALPNFANLTSRDFVFEENSSDVSFDRDVVIETGVTATIPAGWKVGFGPGDSDDQGRQEDKAELVVRGALRVEGTSSSGVTLNSPTGAAGPWGGVVFELTGCLCTGYGYSSGVGSPSAIEHATIRDATMGVVLTTPLAPNLIDVTFENITGSRHIYADGTDVVIPKSYWPGGCEIGTEVEEQGVWDLKGGTHVVFSNETTTDLPCVGVPGKADLMVDGLLLTDESEPEAGDYVYFEPETPTDPGSPDAGQDWGGVFMSYYSVGSVLRYADVGYAANPVYLYYPQSTPTLTNSRIHHFADVGVWVYQTYGVAGPVLEGLLVERGDDLEAHLAETAVYLDRADGSQLRGSTIRMVGRISAYPTNGVHVYFTNAFCASPTGQYAPFEIAENVITGPGRNIDEGDSDLGINAFRLCGEDDLRPVAIQENLIQGWKGAGMYLSHGRDHPVVCNAVIDCGNGIDVVRGSTQPGPAIKFASNRMEAVSAGVERYAFRTNDATYVQLGPIYVPYGQSATVTGTNQLAVNVNETKFIYEVDPDNTNALSAEENYWFTYTPTPPTYTLVTQSSAIGDRIAPLAPAPEGATVAFGDFFTTQPTQTPPDCGAPSTVIPRRGPESLDSPRDDTVRVATPEPTVLALGAVHPNPASRGVVMELQVPHDRVGEYEIQIFDVRGRLVHESRRAIDRPGRHEVAWEGQGSSGPIVGSGIYFLRVRGPGGFLETRKAVVVR